LLENKTNLMVLFFTLRVPQMDHEGFFDAGPKAVKIEYEVIPKSKLDTKIIMIVAVSMCDLFYL